MIELEFIESPDKDVVGKKILFFDEITIGKRYANNILVSDPGIIGDALSLQVTEKGVRIKNLDAPCFFMNKIKVSGTKLYKKGLKERPEIRIGDTVFTIISFKPTAPKIPELDVLYQKEVASHPHKKRLFSALEDELTRLETEKC